MWPAMTVASASQSSAAGSARSGRGNRRPAETNAPAASSANSVTRPSPATSAGVTDVHDPRSAPAATAIQSDPAVAKTTTRSTTQPCSKSITRVSGSVSTRRQRASRTAENAPTIGMKKIANDVMTSYGSFIQGA